MFFVDCRNSCSMLWRLFWASLNAVWKINAWPDKASLSRLLTALTSLHQDHFDQRLICTMHYALCSSWHYTVDKKSHSAIQLTFEYWPIYQQLHLFYRYSLFKPSEDPISHLLPSADDCCSDGQQLCSLVIHTRVCNLSSLLVTMIFAVLLPSLLMMTMMLVAIVNLLISSFQSSPLPFLDCRVTIYIQ